jgi:glucose-1-phosphate cytidylyltransferase
MKLVILAGGMGTRISEESHLKPKPMIEIGGLPLIWHLMKLYSYYGIRDFVICLGYKGYIIKEYFANYVLHMSDVTFDFEENKIQFHRSAVDKWNISLVDTGQNTMTGGRLRRVRHLLERDTFCFTYGDGLSNVNIEELINTHKSHGRLATVTTVQPPGRFGALEINNSNAVINFNEKPPGDGGWINGGFFVLEPGALDYIEGDETSWEQDPLKRLASDGELIAYKHEGFWQAMDTMRDKMVLEGLWSTNPPWRVWS